MKVAAVIGVASILGVQGGVLLAEALPGHVIRKLFGILLLITSGQLVWRTRRAAPDAVAE